MGEVEKIVYKGKIIAIVLKKNLRAKGTSFYTPDEFSQQLGLLVHEKGKVVKPHKHNLVKREIVQTQEVLILQEGKMKVDLYNDSFQKIKTVILTAGDIILLASGGHGIEILENSRIIEVKQGPYAGFDDKEYLAV